MATMVTMTTTDDQRMRAEQVNFRLTADELAKLEELEELTGENKSVILRRLIRAAHRRETRKSADNT